MANILINQLPPASTLTGAEVIPIQQGGTTAQTTAAAIALLNTTSGGTIVRYANAISATLSAGSTDYGSSPPVGYVAGTTNQLLLTPNVAGSTLVGLLSTAVGFSIMIYNASSTAYITFSHRNAGSSVNQFTCPGAVSAILGPYAAVTIVYVSGIGWVFT